MANITVPDLPELAAAPATTDLLTIVDVNDTAQSYLGSNRKVKAQRFAIGDGTNTHNVTGGGSVYLQGYTLTADSTGTVATTGDLIAAEEDGWVPQFRFNGASAGITYATNEGRYIKIGNLVMLQMNVQFTSRGAQSDTAIPTLSNIPYNFHMALGGVLRFWREGQYMYPVYGLAGNDYIYFPSAWTKGHFEDGVDYYMEGVYFYGSFS